MTEGDVKISYFSSDISTMMWIYNPDENGDCTVPELIAPDIYDVDTKLRL